MSLLKHRNYNVSTGNIMKKQRPPKSDNNKLSSLYLKTLNEKINEIFNSQYEDNFPSILRLKQKDFLSLISSNALLFLKEIYQNNELFSSYAKDSIKKSENLIKDKYLSQYKILSSAYNTYLKNTSSFQCLKRFRKHCPFTEKFAYHSCKNNKSKLIQIFDTETKTVVEYLICIECKMCYPPNAILLYCTNCKCDYYSSIISPIENINILPATWSKYHCGSLVNETMKCIKCKNVLYLNLITKMLVCLNSKCNFTAKPQSIIWNCAICKKEFNSDAKIFNPMELQVIKKAIKQSLLLKHRVYPKTVPCCKVKPDTLSFYHKNECKGTLYQGTYNKQQIVVCSKCNAMNFYDKFIWTCPLCRNRFRSNTEVNYSKIEWGSFFGSRKGSDLSVEQSKRNAISSYCENKYSHNMNYLDSNNNQSTSADIGEQGNSSENNTNNSKTDSCIPQKSNLRTRGRYHTLIEILEERNPGLRISLHSRKSQSRTEGELMQCISQNEEEKKLLSRNSQKISDFSKIISKSEYNRQKQINNVKPTKKIVINLFESFNIEEKKKEYSPRIQMMKKKSSKKAVFNFDNSMDSDDEDDDDSVSINASRSRIHTIPSMVAKSNNILKEIQLSSKIPSFNMDDYKILKPIGEGSYGKIYTIMNLQSKAKYALKKIIAHDGKEIKKIQKEFELVYTHPASNIMKIYNIEYKCLDFSTYSIYVLMELANADWNMEIKKRMEKKMYYKENELIAILKQLVNALAYLQIQKVAHRDIKPQNILLYSNSVYKVADFGEAKEIKISKQQNTLRGTELYMSPVLFHGLKLNKKDVLHNVYKSDVFSLGYCVLFASALNFRVINEIRELKEMKDVYKVMIKYLGIKYSKKFYTLLLNMIEYDEKKRFDFIELEQYLKDNY